jgi:hypothetical protein
MKTTNLQKMAMVIAVAGLALTGLAQDYSGANTGQSAAVNAPGPQMVYGVPQIIRLSQAKVSDDTILAYVNNGGIGYSLNADQIIYLRQQGVSDPIITAMLNHPKPAGMPYPPATPAPQPVAPAAYSAPAASTYIAPVPTPTVAPTVTYVQTAPPIYYYQPYYQPYYYPAYGIGPALSLSFAWGGGWHGGGWHH